jgi:hypothetical protein
MLTIETFVEQLLGRASGLKPIYEEHLADYDQLLPHVFMGDVTRYVMSLQQAIMNDGDAKAEGKLSGILDLFEAALAEAEPYVQELVVLSFLENLERHDPGYASIKQRLGAKLSSELDRIE